MAKVGESTVLRKVRDVKTNELHNRTGAGARVNGADYAIPLVEVTEGEYQEPLALMLYGDPGSGKSRLIATAPDPIGVLPMERKSRQTILHTAQELGKRIIMPSIDLIRPARAVLASNMVDQCVSPESLHEYKLEDRVKAAEAAMQKKAGEIPLDGAAPECCLRCYHRWHANRSKSVAFRMAAREDIRTIAIDTFGQLTDDILFANYGRNEKIMPLDRKQFNREMCDFLNEISHKNLILTHHAATVWKDNKPTNKSKPMSSWAKIGHYATMMAHMSRSEVKRVDENGNPFVEITYLLSVNDCQSNTSLIGLDLLQNEAITFANLAQWVYPESDPDNWN
jgi:hypothetical protein